MVYKISFKTILFQLIGVIVIAFFAGLGSLYLVLFRGAEVEDVLPLMIGLGFLFSLDSIVLFTQYFWENRGVSVEFLDDDKAKFSHGANETVFTSDMVNRIDLNLSYPVFDNRIGWGGGEGFIFAKFILLDGREFILSSLISPKLELPKPFYRKTKKVRRFRCWL